MTDKLDGYLEDYAHFLAYREHRRPEVWADRNHWKANSSLSSLSQRSPRNQHLTST